MYSCGAFSERSDLLSSPKYQDKSQYGTRGFKHTSSHPVFNITLQSLYHQQNKLRWYGHSQSRASKYDKIRSIIGVTLHRESFLAGVYYDRKNYLSNSKNSAPSSPTVTVDHHTLALHFGVVLVLSVRKPSISIVSIIPDHLSDIVQILMYYCLGMGIVQIW